MKRKVARCELLARRQWRLTLECGHVVTVPRQVKAPRAWPVAVDCPWCDPAPAVQLDLIDDWLEPMSRNGRVTGALGGTG